MCVKGGGRGQERVMEVFGAETLTRRDQGASKESVCICVCVECGVGWAGAGRGHRAGRCVMLKSAAVAKLK